MNLLDLPLLTQDAVIAALDDLDKACLRQVSKGCKLLVDKRVKEAYFWGAANGHPTQLPDQVKQVKLHTSGPVDKRWLLHSLAHCSNLESLHVSAVNAWEPAPIKEARRSAKPAEPPGVLAALPALLGMATTGSPLTYLTLTGVGSSLRRVRDRDMRKMFSGLSKQPADAGHSLQEFATPIRINMYRSTLKTISKQLVNLTSLHFEGARFNLCAHYATHQLSHLVHLTRLSFENAEDVCVSHIAPLYLIPNLKVLNLSDIQLMPEEDTAPDPLNQWDSMGVTLDPEIAMVLRRMCEENDWPLSGFKHPAKVLITQLSRCTSLTALNLQNLDLPYVDNQDMEAAGLPLIQLLKPLAPNLKALNLSVQELGALFSQQGIADALCCLTNLTHLEVGSQDFFGDIQLQAMQEKILPNLRHLDLDDVSIDEVETLHALSALTRVNRLNMNNAVIGFEDAEAMLALHAVLEKIGPTLQHLELEGWVLDPLLLAASCTNLTLLNISNVAVPAAHTHRGDAFKTLSVVALNPAGVPYLGEAFFSCLPKLKCLLCAGTCFDDRSFWSLARHCHELEALTADECLISGERLAQYVERFADDLPILHKLIYMSINDQIVKQPSGVRTCLRGEGLMSLPAILPSLKALEVNGSDMTRTAWLSLGVGLQHLTSLSALNTQMTDEYLNLLGLGKLPAQYLNKIVPRTIVPRQLSAVHANVWYAIFPRLGELQVTDDRLMGGKLTVGGVDSLAHSIAIGNCRLRELRVAEPDPEEESDDTSYGSDSDGDDDSSMDDGDDDNVNVHDGHGSNPTNANGSTNTADVLVDNATSHGHDARTGRQSGTSAAGPSGTRTGNASDMNVDMEKPASSSNPTVPASTASGHATAVSNHPQNGAGAANGGVADLTTTDDDEEEESSEWETQSDADMHAAASDWDSDTSEETDESDEDSDEDSEWEEVVPGQDERVDKAVGEKLKVQRRPRIVQHANVSRWLSKGLLVRPTVSIFSASEMEDRARAFSVRDRSKPWLYWDYLDD